MSQREAVPYHARTGDLISSRMGELGMSIKELAKAIEVTYEHARRIVKEESVPSKQLMKAVSGALEMPRETLESASVEDKIRIRYKDLPASIIERKAGLEPIERVWENLGPDQRENLIALAQSMARNRRLPVRRPFARGFSLYSRKLLI